MANNNVRSKNIKGLFQDPRKRMMIIITGVVVVGAVLWGVKTMNSKPDMPVTASSNITNAPKVTATPGTSTSEQHNELQRKQNAEKTENAIKTGQTSLPTLVNNTDTDKKDPFANLNNENIPEQQKPTPAPVVVPPVQQIQQIQPVQQVQQQKTQQRANNSDEKRNLQNVQEQLVMYMGKWAPGKAYQEVDYSKAVDQNKQGQGQQAFAANNNNVQQGSQQQQQNTQNANSNTTTGSTSSDKKGAAFVRAGTIVPAVLETAINSDEPGPVLARIVTGPLAGARLIGSMKTANETIVVQFTTLSIPGAKGSFRINTYAVDPDSSNTGLASDVNHHYLARYGLGLAAAFISGYGEAVQSLGSSSVVSNGTVVSTSDLNNKQIAESALGKVGQKLGSNIDRDTNIPTTVKVNSGISIGVLFMSDF